MNARSGLTSLFKEEDGRKEDGRTINMIPMPAALLFTAKPGTGLTFKSDTFRLLSTLEQALTDENEDGRREDGRTTINMTPVPG